VRLKGCRFSVFLRAFSTFVRISSPIVVSISAHISRPYRFALSHSNLCISVISHVAVKSHNPCPTYALRNGVTAEPVRTRLVFICIPPTYFVVKPSSNSVIYPDHPMSVRRSLLWRTPVRSWTSRQTRPVTNIITLSHSTATVELSFERFKAIDA
jgi:hypothetical protein